MLQLTGAEKLGSGLALMIMSDISEDEQREKDTFGVALMLF